MAVRCDELDSRHQGGAAIVHFPTARVRAEARARRRLEIRRRRVAAVVLVLLVTAFIFASGPGGTSVASRSGAPAEIVVRPGDTVWDLAERFAPPAVDRRAYVDAVLDLNGISGSVPAAGDRLRLPR